MIQEKNDNVLIGHIDNLQNQIDSLSATVGVGALNTTAKTLIGGINELKTFLNTKWMLEKYERGNVLYASKDTHYQQLGYWDATRSFDNLVLLITCSFWGNQHGNGDILFMQQDANTNGTPTVKATSNVLHLGGSHSRDYYQYLDQTNQRVYFYVYVTGGNSYGKWNMIPLLSAGGTWHPTLLVNQNLPSGSSKLTYV